MFGIDKMKGQIEHFMLNECDDIITAIMREKTHLFDDLIVEMMETKSDLFDELIVTVMQDKFEVNVEHLSDNKIKWVVTFSGHIVNETIIDLNKRKK